MLDLERLELHNKVHEYNRGLAGYAGLSEKLKGEIARLEQEEQRLQPKLRARLDAGDRVMAGRHAMRLETIADELQRHRAQWGETEATYKELVRAREVALVGARDRIESLKRSIGELKVQRALADLTELAAGMHGSIGVSDGTLERIQERVDEKRDFAKGRVRVARDAFDTEDVRVREAEQAAIAEAALRRYESAGQAPAAREQDPPSNPQE
jgi:phage shock protein A